MSLVTYQEVELALGRTFTTDQQTAVTNRLDELQSEIEAYLGRLVERRQVTVSVQATPARTVNLLGPVITVLDVRQDSEPVGEQLTWRSSVRWAPDAIYINGGIVGAWYRVMYYGGDYIPNQEIKSLIRSVAVRDQVVGISIASGALSSLNVEGTSVGFGGAYAANGSDMIGSFTPAELGKIKRLRRIVTR